MWCSTAASTATFCGSERVVLGSKARVQGNVHYGVIEMALGAEISGKLVPGKTEHAGSGGTASSRRRSRRLLTYSGPRFDAPAGPPTLGT